MLKRNFDEIQFGHNGSDSNGEPRGKRTNHSSLIKANETTSGVFHIETNFGKSPAKEKSLVNLSPLLSELLEKKPDKKDQLSDNVLEYFDEKTMVGLSGSKKENIDGKPFFDNNYEPRKPKSNRSTNSNDAQIPQMILNPTALLKAPNLVNNPPDVVPISDQAPRHKPLPHVEEGWQSSTPKPTRQDSGMADEKGKKSSFSEIQRPECCVIEKLVKRFHCAHARLKLVRVPPLAESELHTYIRSGRPTPAIPSLGMTMDVYERESWITGCPTLRKLYCWICLLFRSAPSRHGNSIWVREGFTTMNLLESAMAKHVQSAVHLEAMNRNDSALRNFSGLNRNLGQISNEMAHPTIMSTNNQLSLRSPFFQTLPQEPRPSSANMGSYLDTPVHGCCSPQAPPFDSSITPRTTPDELSQGNPVVSRATHDEKSAGFHCPTPRPEIYNLTQFEDYNTSATAAQTIFSGSTDSSKRYLEAKSRYLKLIEELEKRELAPMSSSPTPPPLQAPPTPEAAPPKIQPLPEIDIGTLLTTCFPNGTFNGSEVLKQQIIGTGRPTPEMPGFAQLGDDGVMRHFDMSYYDEFPWMCGSAELNRIYCWPCLVLNDYQHTNTWNTVGFSSLLDLPSAAKTHSMTQTHLELAVNLKLAEEILKSGSATTSLNKRNEIVGRKRSLLKYLIDAVCFKKKLLSNETCHKDFEYFLKFLSTWVVELKSLLDPKSANYLPEFTPNAIPNYSGVITKALKTILKRKIAEEVENSVYVSFILKTVQSTRTALMLRYTKSTGEVRERFYKFIKIGFGDGPKLMAKILMEVSSLKCSAKFVGISYDGGLLRPDEMESFNSALRKELMAPYFFHHHDHNFKELLQQSLSHTPYCRSFFCLLAELGKFLQENPQALHLIKCFENETPYNSQKSWDLKSGIVLTVRDHFLGIIKFMDQAANKTLVPAAWTNHEISQCAKFSIFLRLRQTRLLLVLFSTIYLNLKPLIEAFQSEFDATNWKNAAEDAYGVVLDIRIHRFGDVFKAAEGMGFNDLSTPAEERTRLTTMFNDTVDWILGFIKCRTKYINTWAYFDFATNKIDSPFAKARLNPTQFLMELKECFPFSDFQKLGSELIFAHNHERFRNKSSFEILQVMVEWDLKSVLPQLYDFLLLVLTVPQSSVPVGSPVSGKVASYVEGKTQLKSADTLFYVEKDLLAAARHEEDFYNDVIRIVAELKQTDEFIEIDQSGKLVEQLKFMCIKNNDVIEND